MKALLFRYRWPFSLLLATVVHIVIIWSALQNWRNQPLMADENAAPMVIQLAPLASNQVAANDTSQVEVQPKQHKKKPEKLVKQPVVAEAAKPEQANTRLLKERKAEPEVVEPEKEPEPQPADESEPQIAQAQEVISQVLEAEQQQQNSAPLQGHDAALQIQQERSWQSQVMALLAQKKRYPRKARQRKQEGIVFVRFLVDHSGQVDEIEIVKKSRFTLLNNEARDVISRAAPLPSPPAFVVAEGKRIVVPIKFNLM